MIEDIEKELALLEEEEQRNREAFELLEVKEEAPAPRNWRNSTQLEARRKQTERYRARKRELQKLQLKEFGERNNIRPPKVLIKVKSLKIKKDLSR